MRYPEDMSAVRYPEVHERAVRCPICDTIIPLEHPIRMAPMTILSAHRAGSVREALWELGRMVADDLEAIVQGLPPQRLQLAQPELIGRFATNRVPRPRT